MIALKILAALLLLIVFYQDDKERLVHGFLFPGIAVCLGILHYRHVEKISFYVGVVGNVLFISIIILFLFLYTKLKMKIPFLNGSFGLGDLLFFYAICFAFPNLTFVVAFVFSVFFAFVLHLLLNNKSKHNTVPLAGYMALFFALLFFTTVFLQPFSLYLI